VIGIRDNVFENREITSMYLLDGLLDIGANAFKNCVKMQSIEIPSTVVSLGESVLQGCVELTQLTLPQGLLYIGANAFLGCEKVEEIVLPEGLLFIGANAFDENTVVKIRIKESEKPSGWDEACFGNATVVWEYVGETEVDQDGNPIEKKGK
jgi:hypothetical protein